MAQWHTLVKNGAIASARGSQSSVLRAPSLAIGPPIVSPENPDGINPDKSLAFTYRPRARTGSRRTVGRLVRDTEAPRVPTKSSWCSSTTRTGLGAARRCNRLKVESRIMAVTRSNTQCDFHGGGLGRWRWGREPTFACSSVSSRPLRYHKRRHPGGVYSLGCPLIRRPALPKTWSTRTAHCAIVSGEGKR
jgi:hypothetical protein